MRRRRLLLSSPVLYAFMAPRRTDAMEASAPAGLTAPYRKGVFAGRIDGRDPFILFLKANPQGVEGTCRSGSGARLLRLQGPLLSEGKIALDVHEQPYGRDGTKRIGRIVGTWAGGRLTGTWHTFSTHRTVSLDAVETASTAATGWETLEPLSSAVTKREALAQSVGRFRLVAISGHCCLSNDYEVTRSDRGWQVSGTSIVGGSRGGFGSRLGRGSESAARLNALSIVVAPNLAVSLFAGKQRLLDVPFDETGMLLRIDKQHELDSFQIGQTDLKTYSPSTTFVEPCRGCAPQLVLALVSGQNWSEQIGEVEGFNLATQGVARLVLRSDGYFYGDEFELTIAERSGTVSRLTFWRS